MRKEKSSRSPKWSNSTKVIVTLLILASFFALLFRFSNLINTLVAAFIFAVLFHPIAEWINNKTHIPWAWSVSIVYLVTVVIIFSLIMMGGIALINQIEGLVNFLQNLLYDIPDFLYDITNTIISIGPFELDLSYINWEEVSNQMLTTIEPVISRTGNVIGGIATGAFGTLGSFLFSLLISYLLITETEGVRERMLKIELPVFHDDFVRLGKKINKIWSEFLRGQTIIFLGRFIMYLVILTALRVRFVLGMAFLATLGNFIPYIGVAIVWIINFFVALFQGTTVFGLNPLPYALIVMGIGWIIDNIYDSIFAPRIMANVLKLHPAAVLIAVLVGLNLFGLLGMFLAPPLLATIKVLFLYTEKKLLDRDPWPEEVLEEYDENLPFFARTARKISNGVKNIYKKVLVKDDEMEEK